MSWRDDTEGVQFVIDDETMGRLRTEADQRGVEVELLMVELLSAASRQVDSLLGPPRPARTRSR